MQTTTLRRLLSVLPAIVVAWAVGCGVPGGPPRYDLQGSITYDGQPIGAGEIYFAPDASQGNTGPGAFAAIHKGNYQTPPGQGVVGGPHTVRITGYAEPPAGEGAEGAIEPLFPTYQTTLDLPSEDAAFDIEVPKQ